MNSVPHSAQASAKTSSSLCISRIRAVARTEVYLEANKNEIKKLGRKGRRERVCVTRTTPLDAFRAKMRTSVVVDVVA